MFYPENAIVPEKLLTEEFLIRPLRATDVDLDYGAVMTSRDELLLQSAGRWPREGFTIEENLADLMRHEQEHLQRIAFTYTIMNPTETECLGCLYINPLRPLLQGNHIAVENVEDTSCSVIFWVRQSRLADRLDQRVLQTMIAWFQTEWEFTEVVYRARKAQERHIRLFEKMGMRLRYTLPDSVLYYP